MEQIIHIMQIRFKKESRFGKIVVSLQPTLGARASSPAIIAGEDARVPRQTAVITGSYIDKRILFSKETNCHNYHNFIHKFE